MANSAVYPEPTWDVLTSLEPRLAHLAAVAIDLHPADEEGWAYRVRAPLRELVGWESREAVGLLASSLAYTVAFDHLLALREGA